MKSFTIAAGILALTSSVAAQFTNQSAPFNLVVRSDDEQYNGSYLNPCHEGAGIESLCTYKFDGPQQTYYFNYSNTFYPPTASQGQLGIVAFNLQANIVVPSALEISYNPTSNVAVPLFFPGSDDAQIFSFTKDNLLAIPENIDDTVSPPKSVSRLISNRWYICETNVGYVETTLALSLGTGKPENPSCVPADVLRVFV